MSYFRQDDRTHFRAKVRNASWACRGVVFSAAGPYCSGSETDGILHPDFERDHIFGRDGRRAFKEALERGFIHAVGDLCERCITNLREAGTEPPVEGYYLHDYLEHNPSKREVNQRRRAARDRQSTKRGRDRQASLPWEDAPPSAASSPSLSRVTDAPEVSGVEGGTTAPDKDQESIPARPHAADLGERVGGAVGQVIEILTRAPRFQLDPIGAPVGIESAIAAHLDKDPVKAAHEAVVWVSDPAFRDTNGPRVFLAALRKQQPPASAGRSRVQREADDLAAIERLSGRGA